MELQPLEECQAKPPVGLHPSLQRREHGGSALTERLLGRMAESGWTGADVNGLGGGSFGQRSEHGRLGRREPGRQGGRETAWADQIGVVLCNSSLEPGVADTDARNFIFCICFFFLIWVVFFLIFGLHLLPAHMNCAISVIRASTRKGTEQKHVFITFSLVLLEKLFYLFLRQYERGPGWRRDLTLPESLTVPFSSYWSVLQKGSKHLKTFGTALKVDLLSAPGCLQTGNWHPEWILPVSQDTNRDRSSVFRKLAAVFIGAQKSKAPNTPHISHDWFVATTGVDCQSWCTFTKGLVLMKITANSLIPEMYIKTQHPDQTGSLYLFSAENCTEFFFSSVKFSARPGSFPIRQTESSQLL